MHALTSLAHALVHYVCVWYENHLIILLSFGSSALLLYRTTINDIIGKRQTNLFGSGAVTVLDLTREEAG